MTLNIKPTNANKPEPLICKYSPKPKIMSSPKGMKSVFSGIKYIVTQLSIFHIDIYIYLYFVYKDIYTCIFIDVISYNIISFCNGMGIYKHR